MNEKEANEIAKDIMLTAKNAGIIDDVSRACRVDKHIYEAMFEGSIKNGLLHLKDFVDFEI